MDRFAHFRGYIVTANENGSIPLNAKVVCNTYETGDGIQIAKLIAQANLAAALVEVLEGKLGLADQPDIKAARVAAAREVF